MLLLKEPDLFAQKNIPPIEKHSNKAESPPPPDLPDIIRLALSRILDEVTQLDEILPDLDREKAIRIAYVSDGMVYNVPHWADPASRTIYESGPSLFALSNRKQKDLIMFPRNRIAKSIECVLGASHWLARKSHRF